MTLSGNKRAPLVCLSSARLKSTVLYLHRTRLRYTVCTPVSALCLYLGSAVHVYLMGCMCRVQYQASAVQVYLSRCIQNALMYSARWWYYKKTHGSSSSIATQNQCTRLVETRLFCKCVYARVERVHKRIYNRTLYSQRVNWFWVTMLEREPVRYSSVILLV